MNKILLLMLISLPIYGIGQIANRLQPDSIYSNRQVKKIFVYLNSPRDLSEIIEFDRSGKKISTIKYSASYNRRTRKVKWVEKINQFKYDKENKLVKVIDSIGKDTTTFQYGKNGKLKSSIEKVGNFVYHVNYRHNPFGKTTFRKNDSVILYQKTTEYDRDFYVKRFYGFELEPKLKKITDTIDGIPNTLVYKDYNDLEKFKDDETITNHFNAKGILIKSEIHSIFLNNRVNDWELNYKYFKNGLLKSIRGYVPRYFKYEFWD